MTIRPIKKIKVVQEDAEQQVNEDPFQDINTIPELLEMAYAQEIETKYLSVIETIILRLNSEDNEKIWIYGPNKISKHITRVVSNVTARAAENLVPKLYYPPESIHLFDLSVNSLKKSRSVLYKVLEKTNPQYNIKSKFIFQIPRVADMLKLDKRIVSRMDGIKVYVKEIQESGYIKIFSRIIEVLKSREEVYAKRQVVFDFSRIENGLSDFVYYSYLIDNSYEGMSIRFYKYIYDVKDPSPYKLLNSIHLIILMAATIKRVTLCSVYEEFERRVNNIPHFKKISKDTVFRRLTDLMSLGLIARGYFTSDRLELEAEIISRDEVYLKVMLERVKKYWSNHLS